MHTLQQLQSGALRGITRVKLSCGLNEIPEEIFDLEDTLEILDLSANCLHALPDDFIRLKKLKILFLSNNEFTVFPNVLGKCLSLDMIGFKANKIETIEENALPVNLRWLILTNNCIVSLPKSIGQNHKLQKVMLAGNRLKKLPDEMSGCLNLELLRISANAITELPKWLFTLPRLSWLAYAGNPCDLKQNDDQDTLREIPWSDLSLKEQLGEGASGIIMRASWKQPDKIEDVAVKVFKGEVTSDGMPIDEMKACVLAGDHTSLVTVLGKISNHPEQNNGLVFALIPSSYKNLGGPPSFDSCTRDTYADNINFSLHTINRIALSIASAAWHLHQQGLNHGDLYAHNILTDENANTLLGDFGAATCYDKSGGYAQALQRIEVRAFGCLLDDLITHSDTNMSDPDLLILQQIRDRCLQQVVLARPDFKQIILQLKKFKV